MLKISNLIKEYRSNKNHQLIIDDFSLTADKGEFIALLGPSGCGKSTLLKIVAGLEPSSKGQITLNNETVHKPGKERGMVFQNLGLFPWLSVKQNIEFSLKLHGINTKEKLDRYLKITELEEHSHKFPKYLSGGQKQRVAIARTLAADPKVLLMDEPFAALDSQTRNKMQEFLTTIWEQEKKTVLFVTHDASEAIFLADRIIVLSKQPMKIKQEFIVPFPRPRRQELKQTWEFFQLKNQIEQSLMHP
jgi:ABC-type nitrate/sulfonate/bicarbonate transport system ATPase subunit